MTCQSIRTSSSLNAPELRLHARGSARTLDCCALPAAACECWPAEPQLMPHPPVVAKSCSNPCAHKAKVHYQRGTLVESRPCWQVVPFPRQSPALPSTSQDEHHPNPEPFCQSSLFPFPRFPQHSHSPCTPAFPLYTPWQITPHSLQSTSAREHHTSDNTTCTHIPTHQNLHSTIHGGHVCEDCPRTHNILHILSHAYVDVRSYLLTVQNAPVFPIPNSHSPDRPLPSTRQVRRRFRAILQVLLAPTLSPTRCIPAFTPSYIIPWCVPPTNTNPHPGHVSLGTTSPLLLQSSGLFPVDLPSLPSSLDISARLLCSYLKVLTMSSFALIPHLDMMSQIFLLHHFLRCIRPSFGICFSFLQCILAHQNFVGVRNLTRGRHLITPSARLCLC